MPPAPDSRLKRLMHGLLQRWRYILAGSVVKWGSTAALLFYLRAHGMRPLWGILIGIVAGLAIFLLSFWNAAES
ncbi:MAG TPA: hypothetical protein VK176_12390 [Phycisphaerales bacterium]|nr:hypothetical protein [Phycisphaerales bacterium]